jgi:hypothetical protein
MQPSVLTIGHPLAATVFPQPRRVRQIMNSRPITRQFTTVPELMAHYGVTYDEVMPAGLARVQLPASPHRPSKLVFASSSERRPDRRRMVAMLLPNRVLGTARHCVSFAEMNVVIVVVDPNCDVCVPVGAGCEITAVGSITAAG